MEPKLLLTDIANIMGCTIHNVHMLIKEKNIQTSKKSNRVYITDPSEFKKLVNLPIPKKTICVQTAKGGIGKTVLTASIAIRLWQYGARVLLVDLDQQANLTKNILNKKIDLTLMDILEDKATINQVIQKKFEGLDILPSSIKNSILNQHMTAYGLSPENTLSDILDPIKDNYDIIMFDCPPAIGHIVTSCVYPSNLIIAPIDPDDDAVDGMRFCWSEVQKINKKTKTKREFRIILNKYDQRTIMSTKILNTLLSFEDIKDCLYTTIIGVSQEFTAAKNEKISIFDSPRQGKATKDIDSVVLEILGISKEEN